MTTTDQPPSQPQTFTTLPILPLSQALDPETKPRFLAALRSALLNVGFLYLSETGLPSALVDRVVAECKGFFEGLPLEEKERIEMKNEKSFLGWSRVRTTYSIKLFFLVMFLLLFLAQSYEEKRERQGVVWWLGKVR